MNPAADNIALLKSAREVLASLDGEQFTSGSEETSTVGCQFRHVMDFYTCFLAGLKGGNVDYTDRGRDSVLENDGLRARRALDEIIAKLEALDASVCDRAVRVRLEGDFENACSEYCDSSVMRELQFLLSHSIHHFTIIRTLLTRHGVELGDADRHFGIAPSSVRHYEHASS